MTGVGGVHCGLSPRGRGKLGTLLAAKASGGSIPAWAGETAAPQCWRNSVAVYPRVGGGNDSLRPSHDYRTGLSPRGRGKPFR